MRTPRPGARDPLAAAVLTYLAFRAAGLAERYLGHGAGGWSARCATFAGSLCDQVALTLAGLALLLLVARLVPRLLVGLTAVTCAGLPLLMFYGEAGFVYSAITGQRLTVSLVRTYGSPDFLRSHEFTDSLEAHGTALAGWLVVWAFATAGIAWPLVDALRRRSVLADAARSAPPSARLLAALALAAVVLGVTPRAFGAAPFEPCEASLARELLSHARPASVDADAVRALRAVVGLPPGATWMSDEYPLVYRPAPDTTGGHDGARPDVFVIFVESLRGADVGWAGSPDGLTPHIDALARRGVTFPHYLSNGYPSAPSFFAATCSAWPHEHDVIMGSFAGHTFDALPHRLRSLGYRTVLTASLVGFREQDRWLGGWYDDVLETAREGGQGTDRSVFALSRRAVERHDASAPGQPIFELIVTTSTHVPWARPADDDDPPAPPGADGPVARYDAALRYTDRQIGAFVDFLDGRPRSADTVVIVVGDHAFPVRPEMQSDLATNDFVWTSAVIAGPARLVGPPRRVEAPASHVDLMPTVLAMVGDRRPTAALGADLFGPPRGEGRQAVVVRTSSVRVDRGGQTLMIDALRAADPTVRPSFGGAPAGPAQAFTPETIGEVQRAVRAWSALVATDRVYAEKFLKE